jgi:hypothetical protein
VAAMGDAGYQGVEKREENLGKSVTWHVAMKRSKRKALPNNKLGRMTEKLKQSAFPTPSSPPAAKNDSASPSMLVTELQLRYA